MLFSEIYGSYFQVVSAILTEAVRGQLTEQRMAELIREKAFAESALTIPSALKNGSWPLLQGASTPLRHAPDRPLTLLEKRWLKAVSLDPRITLFQPELQGLEDVEPLYDPASIVYFDRYGDGDPYEDPVYRENFRILLSALRQHHQVRIRFKGHTGIRHRLTMTPFRLEYSEKDDKFRLLAVCRGKSQIVNLSRIRSCRMDEPFDPSSLKLPKRKLETLTLELTDDRNALERALLHFSHFEKETIRLDGTHYRINLKYEREDEAELLIRVLSFGPVIKATAPDRFVALIRDRLARQRALCQSPDRPSGPK